MKNFSINNYSMSKIKNFQHAESHNEKLKELLRKVYQDTFTKEIKEIEKSRNSYYTDKYELLKHISKDEDKINKMYTFKNNNNLFLL